MTVATVKKLSFEKFLEEYPEDGFFELVNGEIVQVDATRAHKNVARYLVKSFDKEIDRLKLDYIVDKDIIIRTVAANGEEQGRIPDVSVVSASRWNSNVTAYGALAEPIQLAVEVTSTNWENDYIDKLDEYQRLGIFEYWIVDYLAIASRTYLGNPKVPTVFLYQLVDGKYQVMQFKDSERITSPTFPELDLNVEQILAVSGLRNL